MLATELKAIIYLANPARLGLRSASPYDGTDDDENHCKAAEYEARTTHASHATAGWGRTDGENKRAYSLATITKILGFLHIVPA